jgi:acyl-coenzyme A thioesterase 13
MMSSPAKSSETFAFFRSLLPSVLLDASTIKGSLTLEQKQLCANIFTYFLVEGNTYGSEIGERVRLVETDVWEDEGQGMKGRTVCEMEVTKGVDLTCC